MTSKTLFFNLMREDFKKKIWVIVVALITFLFVGPTHMLMRMEDMYNNGYMVKEEINASILYYMSPEYFGNSMIPAAMAIVLGIAGFTYLFSKKKVDMYHSIPVKREKLFFSSYLNGIIAFLFVYLVTLLISIISLVMQGHLTGEVWQAIGITFIGEIVNFLFFYHVTILAVMLTGNLLVCMAATAVLLLYVPLVSLLLEDFFESYFLTYSVSYEYGFTNLVPLMLRPVMSPITFLTYFGTAYGDTTGEVSMTAGLILAFLMSAVILAAALFLYKKRPSEVAGKALSYRIAEPIVRIMVVIPVALGGGKYIQSMGNRLTSFWFWFGLLFTGILCHAIMEVIYRFDFKAVLNHKIQLAGSLVVAVLLALCFQFDWFGYDQYIPREDQIESAAIVFHSIDTDINGYQIQKNADGTDRLVYADKEKVFLDNMKLEDKAAVLSLAKIGIEQLDYSYIRDQGVPIARASLFGREMAVNVSEVSAEAEELTNINYVIRYRLHNGKEINRYYAVTLSSAFDTMAQIYDSQAYKDVAYQLTQIIDKNVITRVNCVNVWGDKAVSVTGDNMQDLLKIYTEEMKGLTLETLQKELPVLRVDCMYRTNDYEDSMYGYYIYPSFHKTLAFIKNMGVDEEAWGNELQADKVEQIIVYDYGYLPEANDYYMKDNNELIYRTENGADDQKKIAELCDNLVLTSFMWSNQVLYPVEHNIEFQITYANMKGMDYNGSANILDGKVPAFVVQDLKDTMAENQEEDSKE